MDRQSGILRNAIYGGKLVWNRVRKVRDPDTGKKVSRANPESEWQISHVPALRIIDEETTAAVEARMAGRKANGPQYQPRNKRLLSGLMICGSCGSGMTIDGATKGYPRIRCSRASENGSCDHKRRYQLTAIENVVVEAVKHRLHGPTVQSVFADAYAAERIRLSRRSTNHRGALTGQIAKKKQEIERLIDAYVEEVIDIRQLSERRATIDTEISRMENELTVSPIAEPGALIADAKIAFDRDTHRLTDLIAVAVPDEVVVAPLRRLVGGVIVHPSPAFQKIEITLAGELDT